jgi:hypothetical protein
MIYRRPGFFIWLHSPPPSSPLPSPVSKLYPWDGGDPPQVVNRALRPESIEMIYRGRGFFIWLHSPPPSSPPPSPVSKLGRRHRGRLRKRDKLLTGEVVGSGVGAKSYDGEKAWFSLSHSVHSDFDILYCKKFSVIYAVINVGGSIIYLPSPILLNHGCRIRVELYYFGKLDPDAHENEKLDSDPNLSKFRSFRGSK